MPPKFSRRRLPKFFESRGYLGLTSSSSSCGSLIDIQMKLITLRIFLGNYTEKYYKTIQILEKHVKDHKLPQIRRPNPPPVEKATSYGVVKVTEQITLNELVKHVKSYKVDKPIHPEVLNIGPNYGQLFGFTLYRTTIPKSKTLHFQSGMSGNRGGVVIYFIYSNFRSGQRSRKFDC